jgi:hypothetical protein
VSHSLTLCGAAAQASTALNFIPAPFTLATFVQTFQLLINNVNFTNQPPQGVPANSDTLFQTGKQGSGAATGMQ